MPPRRSQNPGPIPIESITHDDKRHNIPTADAQEFVTPEVEQTRQILLDRDVSLDPQLVWKGKYDDESAEAVAAAQTLVTDAPPIYIQEKIDPRVLIENLRRTGQSDQLEPELTLFDSFDGLDELDLVDFYKHDANWSNRMILGDSRQVMGSLTEREDLRGKVQMIYIDPPYGIKFGSNWQASARKRDVKDGKVEDAAREAEQIKAFRDTWELGIHSYLTYLRDRLLVARELLTESGSCFIQMSDANLHLVRALLDEVFGPQNHVASIAWKKAAPDTATIRNGFNYIIWAAKSADALKSRKTFRGRRLGDGTTDDPRKLALSAIFPDGSERALTTQEKREEIPLPKGTRVYRSDKIVDSGTDSRVFELTVAGEVLKPPRGYQWRGDKEEMERLVLAERVRRTPDGVGYRLFLDDYPVVEITSLWEDTAGKVPDMVYVVQTNTKLVERCMMMSTDPGDLVLDPTCGSGTTAYVAEQWGRRWITIDTSRVALALARQRLMGAKYPMYLLADSDKGKTRAQEMHGTALTSRSANDIRHGFVYERVQHITLKSIANNPDIVEGMSRKELDAAIKRHAEYETLYDRPYEDKGVVRVSGPFTVESLSPHRSLAFAGGPGEGERETISERIGAEQPDAPTFEQSILENLAKAGVQNGRREERIVFESVEPYGGQYVQAVGVQKDTGSGEGGVRVGIAIGPQYGTVSQRFCRDAVQEAIRSQDINLLCVLGFAFDASTHEVTEADGITVDTSSDGFAEVQDERRFGRIKLLLVRMNVDLLMGEDLKKTGAGNLFTVFGEPDITVIRTDEGVVVELNGVDIYDPTTGEVRSNDTGRIALWMIDTDYNGDSFFVRHCYFTGGGDPYKQLKTALKAEIDADAWAALNATVSRPFDAPTTGKIAVKVINDYGDEVMKVFDL